MVTSSFENGWGPIQLIFFFLMFVIILRPKRYFIGSLYRFTYAINSIFIYNIIEESNRSEKLLNLIKTSVLRTTEEKEFVLNVMYKKKKIPRVTFFSHEMQNKRLGNIVNTKYNIVWKIKKSVLMNNFNKQHEPIIKNNIQ